MAGPIKNPSDAFQQLEAIMLRQMLQSSGAFRAGTTPGAQLRTDMFVETLADAVAKAGGLGVARMLERQIGGTGASRPPAAGNSDLRPEFLGPGGSGAARTHAASGATSGISAGSRVDDLDDPNSEAPLPEDPEADSIDDYQRDGVARRARGPLSQLAPADSAHLTHGHRAPDGTPGGVAALSEVTGQVTSPFGRRLHPISGQPNFHTGVDLRAPMGAPIRAAAGGIVIDAGRRGGYGKAVEIDHGDGTSTLYAHASKVLVGKGQRVDAGEAVGLVGQTGQATGPHLHFELRRNNHPVDPTSGNIPPSITRALNRYRERDEASVAGTPLGVRDGEKP